MEALACRFLRGDGAHYWQGDLHIPSGRDERSCAIESCAQVAHTPADGGVRPTEVSFRKVTNVSTHDNTEPHHEGRFKKVMGGADALFIGFGAMIGFGWITLTGGWLNDAGTWGAMIAMVAGGAIMILVALVYSELVAAMPHAGGEHNYLMRGMGPRASLLGSWAIIGGYVSVILFETVATPRTVDYILDGIPMFEQLLPNGLSGLLPMYTVAGAQVGLVWALIGAVCAIVITWINIRGVKVASLVQTFVVIFIILVALMLVVGGFVKGDVEHTKPFFNHGAVGFMAVLGTVPFLFVGFDVIPQAAEEIRIAPKKIGRLIIWSVSMAVAFYLVVIYVTSLAMPAVELLPAPGEGAKLVTGDAMAVLFGHPVWGKIVLCGGLAGILTSWIAFLMGASRLLWAMANSGMIPAWFGKLHPQYKTPSNALLFLGVLSALAPFLGTGMLTWAVDGGSPMIVLAYALVAIAFVILRRREPEMPRPMHAGGPGFGGVVLGVLASVICVVLFLLYIPNATPISITLDWQSYTFFGLWMLAGVLFALRLPGGVKPGVRAESVLLAKIAARKAGKGGK